MPKCCLYSAVVNKKTVYRTTCTTDSRCPTITGWTKTQDWTVSECKDCKFEVQGRFAVTSPHLAVYEINEARVTLAEAQGRLSALAHFGMADDVVDFQPVGNVEPEVVEITPSVEVKARKRR